MRRNLSVIIDTNLWISFLISKDLIWIDNLIKDEYINIVYSQELFDEIITVLQRPKFKKYLNFNKAIALISLFENHFSLVDVKSTVVACRDHKDNFLLALAKDANADYLITGDKDLLILNPFEQTQILTLFKFRSQFTS